MTILFWCIISGMTLFILGLLLWPLVRRTNKVVTGEQEKTLSIFRQQFAELEQDRANGVLTDELYQQARRELERRLLEETGTTETTPTNAPRQISSRPVAFAIAIIIPEKPRPTMAMRGTAEMCAAVFDFDEKSP